MSEETGQNTAWYYCLKHGTVEAEGQCKATNRLGPYGDPRSAANALEAVHEREERKEREDRAWTDGERAESSPGE